jgi:5-methylcytosine-specific restriction endonuclease McrA
MITPSSLKALTNAELIARLKMLAAQERECVADVVEHLMELYDRELALDEAYASIFEFCVKGLNYSESAAFLRIRAANASAANPEVLRRLRSGRIHLDTIARLYPYLTKENCAPLLDLADGASKRKVLALVASLGDTPPAMRDVIVPVPAVRRPEAAPAPAVEPLPGLETGVTAEPGSPVARAQAPEVIPPPCHRFHFTGDDELFGLIGRLKGLLRHKYPDGRLDSIFKEAAKVLLEKLERERLPKKTRRPPLNAGLAPKAERLGSRIVPRTVKREVWSRDQGRCAFRAEDGTLCGSREALEYDHIVAWADGGRSDTAANIRLLCRAHNQRLGRRRFGPRRRDDAAGAAPGSAGATGV